jgi:hypothetical protein
VTTLSTIAIAGVLNLDLLLPTDWEMEMKGMHMRWLSALEATLNGLAFS